MSELFLLTNDPGTSSDVLPALGLLLHKVRTGPADTAALANAAGADVVLVDARRDLMKARELCRLLRRACPEAAVIAVMTEGSLAGLSAEWGTDDVVLHTAGPAEVEARLRLAVGRQTDLAPDTSDEIRSGDLSIDEATYVARLRNRVLDLTFKEFELLKFLAQHPGRVFTRAQLLQEVWGYDYFGGTRTVDVHVRRLRAKLGTDHEGLVGTVRNVGYRFVPVKAEDGRRSQRHHPGGDSQPDAEPEVEAGVGQQDGAAPGTDQAGASGQAPAGAKAVPEGPAADTAGQRRGRPGPPAGRASQATAPRTP